MKLSKEVLLKKLRAIVRATTLKSNNYAKMAR